MIPVNLLSTYLYCKRKLYLQEVLKLIEIPKEAVIKGRIKHECYDKINKIEENIVKSILKEISLNELIKLYRKKNSFIIRDIIVQNKNNLKEFNIELVDIFKKLWPGFLIESELRAKNIYDFLIKNKVYGEELWQKLTPKIQSEYYISSKELGLKGIIDKLELHENDIVPIELKTGKTPEKGVWNSHKMQIAAYLLLLNEKFKKDINIGFIRYVDSNEERAVILNPFLKDYVLELRDKVKLLLSSEELPEYCDNEKKCKLCGLRKQCFNKEFLIKKLKNKKTVVVILK